MQESKMQILVVDDEEQIVNVIELYLKKEGYKVHTASDGHQALEIFNRENIDFIVLDLMLPEISGEDVCKIIRLESQIPILMLTAKVEEWDRVNGLNIGADDYLVKPFSVKELVARVKAILRRSSDRSIKAEIIEFNNGKLTMDISKREVKKEGKLIDLTPTEFDILSIMSQNRGRVFSREKLIEKVLGYDYEGYDRVIDTHIKNLRHKIEDQSQQFIKTVYRIGYKFLEE
jgi:DNA-binding response OmpR family regulator